MAKIEDAFRRMPRQLFLPREAVDNAGVDAPLPIGYGQTNSQPSTVLRMLKWLDVKEGQKVLDVGSGSGWSTALLSILVGVSGHIDAVEIIPELVAFGRDNCRRAGVRNARFFPAGDTFGLPQRAPYDRILVSAAAEILPAELVDQLRAPGKLVIPVGGTILEIEKDANGGITVVEHPGYIFVPLVRK